MKLPSADSYSALESAAGGTGSPYVGCVGWNYAGRAVEARPSTRSKAEWAPPRALASEERPLLPEGARCAGGGRAPGLAPGSQARRPGTCPGGIRGPGGCEGPAAWLPPGQRLAAAAELSLPQISPTRKLASRDGNVARDASKWPRVDAFLAQN
mmetsp:Transcript_35726/g.109771  ORF Transcript_35726/g.109771 Transcript_35726/m.109771 type:complete len:154 (+) Transcript_35726:2-463(+)